MVWFLAFVSFSLLVQFAIRVRNAAVGQCDSSRVILVVFLLVAVVIVCIMVKIFALFNSTTLQIGQSSKAFSHL